MPSGSYAKCPVLLFNDHSHHHHAGPGAAGSNVTWPPPLGRGGALVLDTTYQQPSFSMTSLSNWWWLILVNSWWEASMVLIDHYDILLGQASSTGCRCRFFVLVSAWFPSPRTKNLTETHGSGRGCWFRFLTDQYLKGWLVHRAWHGIRSEQF